ncbi:MAG: hypothetical protein WCS65_06370 [Verrucomicrobiae bacterium]
MERKTDASGKPVQTFKLLAVPNGALGEAMEMPFQPPVTLYTGTVDPQGKPDMKPYLDIPVKSPKDRLLLLFYLDPQGRQQQVFLDRSETTHPAGTVWAVNLASSRMAFNVGSGSPIPVAQGSKVIAKPELNSDGRFPFDYYIEKPGEAPYHSAVSLLRFRQPGSRLLILFTTIATAATDSEQDPSQPDKVVYSQMACRLFDSIGGLSSTPSTTAPVAGAGLASTPAPAVRQPTAQEQEIALIAPGSQILEGTEIEVGWDGAAAPARTAIPPGEIVRLRAPLSRSATLRFAKGDVIGAAAFGSASRQHLVVLVPGTDAPGPMSVLAFENSVLSHPQGGARVFNLTPYQLAYSMGKEIGYINPREAVVLAFPPGQSTVKLAVKAPAGWKIISEARPAKPEDGKRNAIFVYKVPGKDEFGILEKSP